MWLLTLKDKKDEGAYAVADEYGDKVLFLFEEEDDAERYAMMVNDQETNKKMDIVEVEDEVALKTCKMYNYKYAVITSDDIVIPPKNDNV
jgi:hypothetical protein|tara:strand:+ start:379 stop:648 length:270 start_codon:yes stop_codon:yes gene_type:complete